MKFSREVKTGLLAVIAILLLIFGYSFLKGKNLLDDDRKFYVVYNNVEGLAPSSPVTINGLTVGKVSSIEFLGEQGRLLVTFMLSTDFEFSKSSIAKVYGGGLIGGKSLAILPVFDNSGIAKSGDTLVGQVEPGIQELVNQRLTPLQEKIERVIVSADSVLTAIHQTLSPETREAIRGSAVELRSAIASFRIAAERADGLLANNEAKFNNTFDNLNRTTENFANISDSLAEIDITAVIEDLENSITKFNNTLDKVSNGEGSLGKLLNDDELYENLEDASRQLNELMQDIKLNPKRYVHFSIFGKKPKEYQEPADPDL